MLKILFVNTAPDFHALVKKFLMGTFFCRKPSPNFLSMNSERGIRNEIGLRRERDAERRKTLRALVCVRERMMIGSGRVNFDEEQCDQIWRFIILWASFQSPGQQLFCQNCQHILGNFCNGVKIFNFTREILFGQLFTGLTYSFRPTCLSQNLLDICHCQWL